jgi:hypothetical protein
MLRTLKILTRELMSCVHFLVNSKKSSYNAWSGKYKIYKIKYILV